MAVKGHSSIRRDSSEGHWRASQPWEARATGTVLEKQAANFIKKFNFVPKFLVTHVGQKTLRKILEKEKIK